MFQICICIFFSFTSILAYPTINKNIDRYELSNEFLSQQFGSDFKDALHFHLQPSDIINTGNNLQKHFPDNNNKDNGNFKRPSYVLHTPQPVQQLNRPMDSLMKVQVLSPSEIEAMERGMHQGNTKMYKNPVVVNLPDFAGVPSKSLNPGMPSTMLPNTPDVYQSNQNNMQPARFSQNNYETWPQNQQYIPYIPKTYQQLPVPDGDFEKTMQPSFEKILMKNLQPSSFENNMQNIPQMLQPPQEKKTEVMLQPSLEKPVESSPEQQEPSFNQQKQHQQQQPNHKQQQQLPYGQHLPEKTTEASFDKTMQPSIDEMPTSIGQLLPSTDKKQPSIGKLHPSIDKKQPSTDKIQTSIDQHQIQTPNELIQPAFKTIQPSYKKVQATFEQNPVSYPNMRHPGYEELNSSYDSQPLEDTLKKQNPYEEMRNPSFHNSRIMFYDDANSSAPSDLSRKPLINVENLDRNFEPNQGVSFDGLRDGKHEYSNEKKTGGR